MSKISLFTGLMLLASVIFIACDKKDDAASEPARLLVSNAAITSPLVNPATGQVIVGSNPSPGPAVDVRWNGQFIVPNVIYGAASITTGAPITTAGEAQLVAATYANVRSGAFSLNLAPSGQGGANGVTIYDRITSLLPGKSYTAIAFDFTPLYRVHIMEDDLAVPASGKAKVRFIHAIPPALLASSPRRDTVDVIATGANLTSLTALYPARSFGDAFQNPSLTRFTTIDTGRYNLGVRIVGTPGLNAASGLIGNMKNNIRLQDGKIYTIIARINFPGLPANASGLTIIQHN